MYKIEKITDRKGLIKTDDESRRHMGCLATAKMEDGCALLHCRKDNEGRICDRYIRTSLIQNWEKNPSTGDIMLETMNSKYYLIQVN